MIQIFDSLRGKKCDFDKNKNEEVKMYVCGPTVYDNAHLGHGRSAVAFDIVRRYLEYSGYNVNFVFNTTDIDDKMINRANTEGISVAELASRIIPEYIHDYKALGIKAPSHSPKATDYIEEMVDLIKKIEKEGKTYILNDGIYFDITSFANYGMLSHQKLDELNAGTSIEKRDDKRNHQDFVLWKFKKEGEPSWPSPWGDGRPGWHIECSAMSMTLLGETLDIHGGGLDLKFPHHECEVAQSTSVTGKPFANFWMHNGYITVDEEKMSKSLGNFFTLKDLFSKYHPRVIRFFLLTTHYRSPIEYCDKNLEGARQTLRTLDHAYHTGIRKHKSGTTSESDQDAVIDQIKSRMDNDFDVPGALAQIFEHINANHNESFQVLAEANKFLNIFDEDFEEKVRKSKKIIDEREVARANKEWEKADKLREELDELGIEVEDTPSGPFPRPKI